MITALQESEYEDLIEQRGINVGFVHPATESKVEAWKRETEFGVLLANLCDADPYLIETVSFIAAKMKKATVKIAERAPDGTLTPHYSKRAMLLLDGIDKLFSAMVEADDPMAVLAPSLRRFGPFECALTVDDQLWTWIESYPEHLPGSMEAQPNRDECNATADGHETDAPRDTESCDPDDDVDRAAAQHPTRFLNFRQAVRDARAKRGFSIESLFEVVESMAEKMQDVLIQNHQLAEQATAARLQTLALCEQLGVDPATLVPPDDDEECDGE